MSTRSLVETQTRHLQKVQNSLREHDNICRGILCCVEVEQRIGAFQQISAELGTMHSQNASQWCKFKHQGFETSRTSSCFKCQSDRKKYKLNASQQEQTSVTEPVRGDLHSHWTACSVDATQSTPSTSVKNEKEMTLSMFCSTCSIKDHDD